MLTSLLGNQNWENWLDFTPILEIEVVHNDEPVLRIEDRIVLENAQRSLKFMEERFQVVIPWKRTPPCHTTTTKWQFDDLEGQGIGF